MFEPKLESPTVDPKTKRKLESLGVEKLSDLVGQQVRLCRSLDTNAGVVFAPGSIMEVSGTWRGRLHLCDGGPLPGTKAFDARKSIRDVPIWDVDRATGEPRRSGIGPGCDSHALHVRLSKNLRRAIKRKGWTHQCTADHAGVSLSMLNEVLAVHSSPSVRWLARVAGALEVSMIGLLEGPES